MYYLCSENKGADQLRGYLEADLRLCFRICRLLVFPCGGSNSEGYSGFYKDIVCRVQLTTKHFILTQIIVLEEVIWHIFGRLSFYQHLILSHSACQLSIFDQRRSEIANSEAIANA